MQQISKTKNKNKLKKNPVITSSHMPRVEPVPNMEYHIQGNANKCLFNKLMISPTIDWTE